MGREHVMCTSIIIPFRRLAPIPLCLTSLEICEGIDQHPVILIQQGGNRFDFDRADLDFQYIHVPDDGPFNLGRLRNAAVKAARTEWVTLIDSCLIVPPNFLTFIEHSVFPHRHCLVYFPIRHLDSDTTELVAQQFNSFYERVIPSVADWRLRCETYKGYPVGTDCFTVQRSDYLDIGGYDERYKGSDLAHLDFACRWLNECGRPRRATCDLYHRWRRMEFCADDEVDEMQARKLFSEREDAGFPPIERSMYWG
jgi:hypothetical protein